jgi:platelet-activating factor acetylhydrolase IB subunit alpha
MSRTALTGKRRHRALIAYLSSNNLPSTAAALRAELGLGEDVFDGATAKKYEGLLEKKWTSVVRLQKKVGDRALSLPPAGMVV